MQIKRNVLEDESSLIINTGTTEEETYTEIVKGVKSFNSWARYPQYWSYLEVMFNISSNLNVTSRETYTLFDLFGDVGGATELIWFVLSICISPFAEKVLAGLAGNLMYDMPNNRMSKKDKLKTLSTVKADLFHNLDVANLLARLRMHGFALALLLDSQTFQLLSAKAKTKPIKHPSELKNKHLWRQLELFSVTEMTLISFVRKFRTTAK